MLVIPLSTVDNTRGYARVSHSRQWYNYNLFPSADKQQIFAKHSVLATGVNPAGDTPPPIFWSMGISPPTLLRTIGYSRPVA